MRPIATHVALSVVCLSVRVLGIPMNPAKAVEPIEMPFGKADSRGPKKTPGEYDWTIYAR